MKFLFILSLLVGIGYGYRVEVLFGPRAFLLGAALHWAEGKQELFFSDVKKNKIFRYIPATGQVYYVTIDEEVSLAIPIAGSSTEYLLGVLHEFKLLVWDGMSPTATNLTTIKVPRKAPMTGISNGKCDPSGRLIVGSYEDFMGTLRLDGDVYHLDAYGNWVLLGRLYNYFSSGFAWSSDNGTMYYTNSDKSTIDAFDYNIQNGKISNKRPIFYHRKHDRNDDCSGMTTDSDGNLWVAIFGGHTVLHINPRTGNLLGHIDLKEYASQITSVAFGGKNLDILYVTGSDLGVNYDRSPGSLFAVYDLNVTGAGAGVPFVKKF